MSWQQTEVSVPEGNSGQVNEANLCITLDDVAGGVDRDINFMLTSQDITAGERRGGRGREKVIEGEHNYWMGELRKEGKMYGGGRGRCMGKMYGGGRGRCMGKMYGGGRGRCMGKM